MDCVFLRPLPELLYGTALQVRSIQRGGRPRMGSVIRRAHENQCKEKETSTIRRNEGTWPCSSANCLPWRRRRGRHAAFPQRPIGTSRRIAGTRSGARGGGSVRCQL